MPARQIRFVVTLAVVPFFVIPSFSFPRSSPLLFLRPQFANDHRADVPARQLRYALSLYYGAAAVNMSAWGAPTVSMAAAAGAQPPIATSVSPLQLWLGPDAAHDDVAARLPLLDACFEAVYGGSVHADYLATAAIARARALFQCPAAVAAMAAARAHGLEASGPPAPACAPAPPPKRQRTGAPRRPVFLGVFFFVPMRYNARAFPSYNVACLTRPSCPRRRRRRRRRQRHRGDRRETEVPARRLWYGFHSPPAFFFPPFFTCPFYIVSFPATAPSTFAETAARIPHLRVQKKRLDKDVALAVVNELAQQADAPSFNESTNVLAIPATGGRLNVNEHTTLKQLRFWLGRLVDRPTQKAVGRALGWDPRGAPWHRQTLTNLVEVFSVGPCTPCGSVVTRL